jgi:hypothetical protein
MVARHCSQIEAQENTLGRHYSRFCPFPPTPVERYQSVAELTKRENRQIKRRIGEVRLRSAPKEAQFGITIGILIAVVKLRVQSCRCAIILMTFMLTRVGDEELPMVDAGLRSSKPRRNFAEGIVSSRQFVDAAFRLYTVLTFL